MSETVSSQATVVQPVVQTTVVIVDDHRSFAELLAAALENVPGLTCVGIATSAATGVARAIELRPDIVVMDIQMPRQDGLVAAKNIRDAAPDTIIAIVTAHHDPQWVSKAAQAGASAFFAYTIAPRTTMSAAPAMISAGPFGCCWKVSSLPLS